MKKTIFTITIGALAVLACSNEKDPQPAPKSKTDILTAHEWKSNYFVNVNGDTLKVTQACQKDNTVLFGKDGSYLVKANQKCSDLDTNITGSWKFLNDEEEIVINKNLLNNVQSDTSTILLLTENEVILSGKSGKSSIIK